MALRDRFARSPANGSGTPAPEPEVLPPDPTVAAVQQAEAALVEHRERRRALFNTLAGLREERTSHLDEQRIEEAVEVEGRIHRLELEIEADAPIEEQLTETLRRAYSAHRSARWAELEPRLSAARSALCAAAAAVVEALGEVRLLEGQAEKMGIPKSITGETPDLSRFGVLSRWASWVPGAEAQPDAGSELLRRQLAQQDELRWSRWTHYLGDAA